MTETIERWADRQFERVDDLTEDRPRWFITGHPERPDCDESGWFLTDTGSTRHGEKLYSVDLLNAQIPAGWVAVHVGVGDETINYIERRSDWGHGGEEW